MSRCYDKDQPLLLDGAADLCLSDRTRLRLITDLGVVTVACEPRPAGDLDRVLVTVEPNEVAGWELGQARALELVTIQGRPFVRDAKLKEGA